MNLAVEQKECLEVARGPVWVFWMVLGNALAQKGSSRNLRGVSVDVYWALDGSQTINRPEPYTLQNWDLGGSQEFGI